METLVAQQRNAVLAVGRPRQPVLQLEADQVVADAVLAVERRARDGPQPLLEAVILLFTALEVRGLHRGQQGVEIAHAHLRGVQRVFAQPGRPLVGEQPLQRGGGGRRRGG